MAMAKRFGAAFAAGVAALLLLPLAGCGSDTTSRPPMTVVTPEPVYALLTNPPLAIGIENDTWVALPIPLSVRGTLDITVDWTFSSSYIYMYFGKTSCEYAELAGKKCPFVISSESQTPKPRKLVTSVLDPGTYYLVFYNVPRDRRTGVGSDNAESLQIRLGLTIPVSGERQPVQTGRPAPVR